MNVKSNIDNNETNYIPHRHDVYPQQQYPITPYILNECDGLSQQRTDLTHLKVYTIDPPGCEDADDAFSILYDTTSNITTLYVHIADPTTFFTAKSEIFSCALKNGVTHYPSFIKPRHMFNDDIIYNSSLMNGKKPALSVIYKFKNNKCIDKTFTFSYIFCDPKYRFTYEQASTLDDHYDILNVLKLSSILSKERNKKYSDLEKIHYSIIKHDENNNFYLFKPTKKEMVMKQMIAELAIATNTFVAEIVGKETSVILTRSCDDSKIYDCDNSSAQKTLSNIVKNGVSANYDNSGKAHKIVGSKQYTHSTSPLRRISDVLIHYVLKKIYITRNNIVNKMSIELLNNCITADFVVKHVDTINTTSKLIRNINLTDYKYRYYQVIKSIIEQNGHCNVTLRFLSYVKGFLNIIIEKIDEHNVYFSYCIKVKQKKLNIDVFPKDNPIYNLKCVTCNLPSNKYDTGVMPDIEQLLEKGDV